MKDGIDALRLTAEAGGGPVEPFGTAGRISAMDRLASSLRDILGHNARADVISFAGGMPAGELFDAEGITAAYSRALRSPRQVLQYSTTEGDPRLREAIALRLSARGLETTRDQLVITTGAQQALALLSAALLVPGDAVLVEEPTYLLALQCFACADAAVIPVPCDRGGVIPEALEEAVARHRPKLLYLIPEFHNPTARSMPAERRREVAACAERHGLWIAEDDPYGELRFAGRPEPWIASMPECHDRTVLLGSLSKTMAPGLRLGWLRAPAALRQACVTVKGAMDVHSSTIDQAAAAAYLDSADVDGHLARVCSSYRERCESLLTGLPEALPAGSEWVRPAGGMFVWARLPEGHDAADLLRHATERGVVFVPGAPFFSGPPDHTTLRLSFPTHTPGEITEGVHRLGRAVADMSDTQT
ncbi:PLP-dependent aminotransferase family protein [Streptomyces sp. NPDC013161]|uniref:aminotransferase-like domain-containing protein n=1 Tax=Streptomyces sp. NPDC013161 TaxID=3364862 RepID=UPI0036D1D780